MPTVLTVVCVLLYLWVQSKQLDSIEARLLNADVIVRSVVRHMELVGLSTVLVILLAVPLGVVLTRPFARPLVPIVIGLGNMGQALPSLGVIALFALLRGIGFRYAVYALVVYAFLPVLRNTMVGLRQVDPAVIESGRGMGMTKAAVLAKIEMPLAVPVILAGVRTALVINVGTATIAVLTNAGGLGTIIFSGIVQNRNTVLVAGGILAAVLALLVDYIAGVAEDKLRPRGL
ncbi:MAG: ABC transporter permease [Euzebyales bacterium]|nr:ABC transporter permease [Euzebyales bacterium]